MRLLRAIYIRSEIYPGLNLQDTPNGQAQIADARKFIAAIEEAAAKYLPHGQHKLEVREEYLSDGR